MGSKKTECESIDAEISICRQLDGGPKLIFAASRRKSNVDSHRHYSNPPTCRPSSITWLVENDFNQMLLKFCGQVTWEIKLPLPPYFHENFVCFSVVIDVRVAGAYGPRISLYKRCCPGKCVRKAVEWKLSRIPDNDDSCLALANGFEYFYLSVCLFSLFVLAESLEQCEVCVCVCVGAVALTTTWHCQMSSIIGQSQQKESCTGKK